MTGSEETLKLSAGRRVRITVRGGEEFTGILVSYDEHSNLYLEDVSSANGSVRLRRAVFKGGNINSITDDSSPPEQSSDGAAD